MLYQKGQMWNLPFHPLMAVELLVRAVSNLILVIAKNLWLLFQRFHRHATRRRPSLTGRRSRSPTRAIDPLPSADQEPLSAWHSLFLSDRSFP